MISLPTDNPLYHALAALAIAAFLIAALIFWRPETIPEIAFVAGVTIGAVLAGFSSNNRTLLIKQEKSFLLQDLAKQKKMFDALMSLFSWAIGSCILLVVVSILALVAPFDQFYLLALWIPFVIFALSLFLRCEHTVSVVIKYILLEQHLQK